MNTVFIILIVFFGLNLVAGGIVALVMLLPRGTYVRKEHSLSSPIQHISIRLPASNVRLTPTEEAQCRVSCYEKDRLPHRVWEENGTLYVEQDRVLGGYGLHKQQVTVFLPRGRAETVSVTVATGDVTLEHLGLRTLVLKSATGNLKLSQVCSYGISLRGTTGDIILETVNNMGDLSVELTTGNVRFSKLGTTSASIKTVTGDVEGDFRSDKVIQAETTTGRISVPQATVGGPCRIRTTTGNITVRIQPYP